MPSPPIHLPLHPPADGAPLPRRLGRALDALVRPRVRALGRSLPAFQLCGYTGLAAAVALSTGLVAGQGLALWPIGAVILSSVATFFALAMATKVITGQERLIYYHHEIAVLLVTMLLLRALGQPVLPYLDATLLGVGAFLVCGRVGCLMVGCCHGRPHRWGVCYRAEHAAAGFTPWYVGVRLFPIQAVESLWVLGVVLVGVAMVRGGSPPGAALGWYVVAYDVGRFGFEFVRGDPDRGYLRGFSEAQWTSVLLVLVVVAAERAGALPRAPWHEAAAAGMLLWMGVAALRQRRPTARPRLLNPRHVREIATLIPRLEAQADAPEVRVAATSLGVQLSVGGGAEGAARYTLSSRRGGLDREAAATLAECILQMRHPGSPAELVEGRPGIFHLLVRPASPVPGVLEPQPPVVALHLWD